MAKSAAKSDILKDVIKKLEEAKRHIGIAAFAGYDRYAVNKINTSLELLKGLIKRV